MSRATSRASAALGLVAAVTLVAACSSAGAYDPTPLYTPSATASPSATPSPSASPSPAPTGTDVVTANCLASYEPLEPMPAPGAMPAGSTMREIQQRGRLIAGVSADTLTLAARNPING